MTYPQLTLDRLTLQSSETEVARAIEGSLRSKLYHSCSDDAGPRDRLQAFALQARRMYVRWECQDYEDPVLKTLRRLSAEHKKLVQDRRRTKLAQIDVVHLLETIGRDFSSQYGFDSPVDTADLTGVFQGVEVLRLIYGRADIQAAINEMESDGSFSTERVFERAAPKAVAPPFHVDTVGIDEGELP